MSRVSGSSSVSYDEGETSCSLLESDIIVVPSTVANIESSDESGEDSDELTDTVASKPTTAVSLLSRLRPPPPSDLGRKRRVACNAPPIGKRRSRGATTAEPKNIHPYQRAKIFPGEALKVNAQKKLFCDACREELSLKLSSIHNHVRSAKHVKGKEKLAKKEAREMNIADALQKHNEEVHLKGETLPDGQKVFRVKVVKCFLRAGVPLNKLDCFRDLLEEGAFRLSDRRFLSDLIPFIFKQEQSLIKEEIVGKPVSIIFDGTTRLGEALAIVLRFVDDSFTIQQRLVSIQLLAKSLTGEEIACELVKVLSTTYSIEPNMLLASMRDGASSNGVAMRTMKIVYPKVLDVLCFSHTLNRVGEHFKVPNLLEFMSAWVVMFSHSPKARLRWKQLTGRSMATYSDTRWWSKWEVMHQVMVHYGDVEPFLLGNSDIAPATNKKLVTFLQDKQKNTYFQLELASIIDWGEHFVKATYFLEGDGPLALKCYERINIIIAAIHSAYCPNIQAIARKIATQVSTIQSNQLIQYAKNCAQPAIDYFQQQLSGSMKVPMAAFKAARLFSPQKANEIQPSSADLDCLDVFPFFSGEVMDGLKEELPLYLAKSEDTDEQICPVKWWKDNMIALPRWASAASKVLLVQPSSAASERVFSLLNASFSEQQEHTLKDYIESSIMLQYNHR